MSYPDISPCLAVSPLRSQLAAAARLCTFPGHRRPNGMPESSLFADVKDGTQHAALKLDRLLAEARTVEVPLERALGFARAIDFSTRVLWDALPDTRDLRGAWSREQAAQAALDLRQWAVCDPYQLPDTDLEQIAALADAQAHSSAQLALAAQTELHNREFARESARRRLQARSA